MTCPVDCKQAKTPESACTCSCGGSNHGTQAHFTTSKESNIRKTMTVRMGGNVAKFIEDFRGSEIECQGQCLHSEDSTRTMTVFLGYEHSEGLEDAQGKAWWLFYECAECGYQHSFDHIASELNQVKSVKREGVQQ